MSVYILHLDTIKRNSVPFSMSPLKSFTVEPNGMIYVVIDKQAPGHVSLQWRIEKENQLGPLELYGYLITL
jgi:hypothetical protein